MFSFTHFFSSPFSSSTPLLFFSRWNGSASVNGNGGAAADRCADISVIVISIAIVTILV